MRVVYRESGGIAGLCRSFDTAAVALSSQDEAALRKLVKESRLDTVTSERSSGSCDLMAYEITVDAEGTRGAWSFDDMTIPTCARRLLSFLGARAKPCDPW